MMRAEDGKLQSHLEWPKAYSVALAIPISSCTAERYFELTEH